MLQAVSSWSSKRGWSLNIKTGGEQRVIQQDEQITCGWCGKSSTSKEWTDATWNACFNRQQKRAFKPLDDEKLFKQTQKVYYLCPKCKVWGRADQEIYIDQNGKKHGGKPVIKVV